MAASEQLHDPWLIAAWPGIGHVGVGAVGYLIDQLQATKIHELPAEEYFDLRHVDVTKGIARPGRLPRSMFFEWHDPAQRHDLLLFLGEAQPNQWGMAYCHRLLDYAIERGIKRLFTFAAMATPMHPKNQPKVFAVATDQPSLSQLREQRVTVLEQGQVSGLNGVLLAAGIERGVPGACLMGELPFYAGNVANPGAAAAVLEVFGEFSGISIDVSVLHQQNKQVVRGLLQMFEQMKAAAQQQSEQQEFEPSQSEFDVEDDDEQPDDQREAEARPRLSAALRRRLEMLFREAEQDRTKAVRLKEELDRLGVFDEFEDRFLDLFRKGE